jgi:deoxyadenosine/deoxycytidine kinase
VRSARRGPGYVAVAGTIGAGKTSLTEWLSKRYGLDAVFEPHEANPYLADFYRDMRTWAFHSQLSFLSHKLTLHNDLEKRQRRAIVDRSIYEGRGDLRDKPATIAPHRRARLERVLAALRGNPSRATAARCTHRADVLGRYGEEAHRQAWARHGGANPRRVPAQAQAHALYGSWFDRYDLSPIVRIDTDRMDYVENLVDMIELTRTLDRWLA